MESGSGSFPPSRGVTGGGGGGGGGSSQSSRSSVTNSKSKASASSVISDSANSASKLQAEVQSVKNLNKGTGKLTGSLDGLKSFEKTVVNDLVAQGKKVEIIPKSTEQGVKTPDFYVDGVRTELKTLTGTSLNTGVTRIQEGFKQGASTVIIDARQNGMTIENAQSVLNRAAGTYSNKVLPGRVEIWTSDGVISK